MCESTADNLRELRTRAGLTQKELSQKTGISTGAITNIETGKVKPRALTWQRLLKVFMKAQAEEGDVALAIKEEPGIFLGRTFSREDFFQELRPKMGDHLRLFFDGPLVSTLIDNAEFFSRERYYQGDFSTAVQILGDLLHGQKKLFLPELDDDGGDMHEPRHRQRRCTSKAKSFNKR